MISIVCSRVRKTCTERRCSTSSTPPPAAPTCSHFNHNDGTDDEEEDGVDLADEGAVVSGPHPLQPQNALPISPNGHREPPTFET